MADRTDATHELAEVMAIGGPAAVAFACLAAWLVAGWALTLNGADAVRISATRGRSCTGGSRPGRAGAPRRSRSG
jgi:hypothetical protein